MLFIKVFDKGVRLEQCCALGQGTWFSFQGLQIMENIQVVAALLIAAHMLCNRCCAVINYHFSSIDPNVEFLACIFFRNRIANLIRDDGRVLIYPASGSLDEAWHASPRMSITSLQGN